MTRPTGRRRKSGGDLRIATRAHCYQLIDATIGDDEAWLRLRPAVVAWILATWAAPPPIGREEWARDVADGLRSAPLFRTPADSE